MSGAYGNPGSGNPWEGAAAAAKAAHGAAHILGALYSDLRDTAGGTGALPFPVLLSGRCAPGKIESKHRIRIRFSLSSEKLHLPVLAPVLRRHIFSLSVLKNRFL